jgi:modulator of FtsH protease
MEGWDNFFLGQLGASAALGGLLFVAISLNLSRISSDGALADRALLALCLLLAILVVSSFMLIPGQPAPLPGIEVLLVGLAISVLAAARRRRLFRTDAGERDGKAIVNAVFLAAAVLPYYIGGLLIAADGMSAGLYVVAAAIILSFIKAVLDAWVLLIEINR